MKKLLSMVLAILLLSMSACSQPPAETPATPLEKATACIQEGQFQAAYDLLLSIESPTAEEKTLLAGFRFFPELCDYNGTTVNYTYDDFGNCLSYESIDTLGNFSFYEYTYDADGRVLTQTCTSGYDPTTPASQTETTYTYDEKGNVLTEKIVEDGISKHRTTTYNDKGQLICQVYVYTGQYTTETKYTYDARDYLVLEESNSVHMDNKTSWSKAEYTYDDTSDENRRVHIKRETNSEGSERTYTYIYDAEGLLLEEGNQILGGVWGKEEYTYDQCGNQLTHKQSSGDYEGSEAKYWYQQTYTYDKDNKVIMETTVTHKGEGQVINYTYDDFGNCLKKEWIAEGDPVAQTFTYILLYNPKFAEK